MTRANGAPASLGFDKFVGWAKAPFAPCPPFPVMPSDGGHATGRVRVRLLCPPYGLHSQHCYCDLSRAFPPSTGLSRLLWYSSSDQLHVRKRNYHDQRRTH